MWKMGKGCRQAVTGNMYGWPLDMRRCSTSFVQDRQIRLHGTGWKNQTRLIAVSEGQGDTRLTVLVRM